MTAFRCSGALIEWVGSHRESAAGNHSPSPHTQKLGCFRPPGPALVPATQLAEPKLLPPCLHARVMLSSTAWRSESDNFWSVSTRDIVTAPIIAVAVAIARFLASAGLTRST